MHFLSKIILNLFIIFNFYASIYTLKPRYLMPQGAEQFVQPLKLNPQTLFQNAYFNCSSSCNPWQESEKSFMQNFSLETSINSSETTFTIFANSKIIKLSMNTLLLTTIITIGIAYKLGVFEKLKKYFNPCNQDDTE